ncbi:OsmC family protein [Bizionia gelidisalsuginis]|uniref:OsmC family protein n=1 Tax=Bizionia gelidisalsuginis TaxID=291188 RepID=A0ABY3ME88_9FLAO|nr:bifunctional alpha/beta hydrolase/OsmC family protein [Bizionia gelidisalsuginis]TYC17865.1 OsmC family protein [Bizionia gelidisalsuginis]
MNIQKVTFKNTDGLELKGRLELPLQQKPHNFVLFAHCFTCNKNLSAVRNISKALTSKGFGVLRFDFTGLGESNGDFENTNFSGNVSDLIQASRYLEENHTAPTLLIGHSLGGAAAIFAANELQNIKAIATIGAPSNTSHVENLLKSNLDEINKQGKAVVNLSGRDFTIKKQFLDDLKTNALPEVTKNLNKALLILHSPQDAIVGIKNAEELYKAAKHPKSFVSLDGADHLLLKKEDSMYAGELIASWAKRYLNLPEIETLNTTHHVIASLDKEEGFTTQLRVGNHNLIADEPTSFGGNDFGPSPYEYVSAGLSACTVMTVQMYAKRKKWDLENIEVHTSYSKTHAEDCENSEDISAKIDTFTRDIKLTGHLDDKQKERLLQIADKCPVHKTLHSATQIITNLL